MTLNVMVKPLLKLPLSHLATFSWILGNWKASNCKTKTLIVIKLTDFHCISHIIFYEAKCYSKCYSEYLNIIFTRLEFRKLFNLVQINMVFRSSHSSMFYKIGVLKNYAEFTWKHLRSVTLIKRDFSAGVSLRIFRNF